MKVWVSKYFEPPSVSHQAFPSNSESFPSNLESSVIFGAHSGEHGTRCVWNRWDLKFYVNSCVKMSSAHVSLVTCGIFPCEPNLDWRVTISKFWSFRPRVILSFMGLAVKDGLKFCHAAMISSEPSPNWKVKVWEFQVQASRFNSNACDTLLCIFPTLPFNRLHPVYKDQNPVLIIVVCVRE